MTIDLTTLLAIWGALLSTIAIGWNIRRDLGDRGKLKVSCSTSFIVTPGGPKDPNTYLTWTVTNVGRRPIRVEHVGGDIKRKGMEKTEFLVMPPRSLPKILEPTDSLTEYSANLSCLPKLKALWASDSAGRRHKAPRKQIKQLRRQATRQD